MENTMSWEQERNILANLSIKKVSGSIRKLQRNVENGNELPIMDAIVKCGGRFYIWDGRQSQYVAA